VTGGSIRCTACPDADLGRRERSGQPAGHADLGGCALVAVSAQARLQTHTEGIGVWRRVAGVEGLGQQRVGARVAQLVAGLQTTDRGISLDGKQLHGIKRAGLPALHVVSAAAHGVGRVLGQAEASEGDVLEAAVAVLQGIPLEGRVVTMDAGLLQKRVVDTVLEKGGLSWGARRHL
jgi:hypothetical protein